MKNIVALWLLSILLVSCTSVQKHNQHLETQINPELLKNDVDFAYGKLQKLHPDLYAYIPKNKLDYKFDSLKKSIQKPMLPKEFYEKLAPVIAEVRQGHLGLSLPIKRYTKKDIKDIKNKKGLLGRYDFLIENDKLFVIENRDNLPNMSVGTEIIAINQEPVTEMLKRYKPRITSDGYNTTFHKYLLAKRWPAYFTIENGILDSVQITTKYDNQLNTFYLKREIQTKQDIKTEKKEADKKYEEQKNKDYNAITKSYNRNLEFLNKDSTIAVMTIKTFSGVRAKKFYKESFQTLAKAKTKYLIIDVRNNFGGSLAEITNLYSYLGANQYPFIKDIEITNRWSMFYADYFRFFPNALKPLAVALYPVYATSNLVSVKKENEIFYLKNNKFSKQKPSKNQFSGEIFFLINGSSFSASSVLTSKMKADGKTFLVGEETGGANDGTVAGRYSTVKLPNSKLNLPIGLMLIQPNITPTNIQKGVVPDKEIVPTTQQILDKNDMEMEWILNEICNKNLVKCDT
ncbi:MAG: S41 family peptidase [Cruoricaptor ignavus]|nr:S41 family peptidase [Cruoricaptor ignavus]